MGEEEDIEEGEAVMEEAVDTLGEEVDMEEEGKEEVNMVEEEEEEQLWRRGSPGEKVGLRLLFVCQIHHLSLHTLFLDHTLSPHYTLSTAPSPPPHILTPSPLSPPYTSSLTGKRREAAVTDACDLGPDIVRS